MKLTRALAVGLVMMAGVGAAHAQTPACTTLKSLLAMPHAQVKALQGAKTEEEKDSITYVSKTQMPGMKSCTIESDRAIDKYTDYWQHHLSCSAELANSEAATQAIESLWSCTKETFSERQPNEAWVGGKYRIIGFDAEVPTAGRNSGLVSFGDTDYARVDIEKSYDDSDEYSLHLYWLFTK
jgi:hypothetical protein